jgi:uncharacterized membrane protein
VKAMSLKLNPARSFYFFCFTLFFSDLIILLNLPILRQVAGFYLITILPGFLILRLLKIGNIKFSEKVLLCLGLSITFIMISGMSINSISLAISISNPLSLYPLLETINILILIISYACYKLNALSLNISYTKSNQTQVIAPILFLFQIPIVGILGALEVRYFGNSFFSLLFIALVTIIVVLISFDRFIPERLYSLSIFLIAFTLLINRTLTSPYLFGSDIHYEYYLSQLTIENSFRNSALRGSNINSMLSVTILPVVYSILLNINPIYVYKIIYSFIFSFVAVGTYEIYNSQIKYRDAFLSAFFLISFYAFFNVMPWLARQEIAELFSVLLILLITIKNVSLEKKSILFIIFMSSLVASHYGMTYIFLFYSILASIGLKFMKATDIFISPSKVLLSCVIALFWYIYQTNSSVFFSIVHIIDQIHSTISNEMFSSSAMDPDIARGIGVGIGNLGFLHATGHFVGIITEVFIVVGLFYTLLKYREMKFNKEWYLFSLISIIFLFMNMILPYLASSLLMYRIYQITLLFISPFCIIGVEAILRTIFPILKQKMNSLQFKSVKYWLLLIILLPYFLFNTGFIYEVIENPSSHYLSMSDINKDYVADKYTNWSYFISNPIPTQDVFACQWSSNKFSSNPVYVDEERRSEVTGYGMIRNTLELTPSVPMNQVIYIGYRNIKDGNALRLDPLNVHSVISYNITDITPSLEARNKIYTNNGSIFYI